MILNYFNIIISKTNITNTILKKLFNTNPETHSIEVTFGNAAVFLKI